MRTNPLYFAYGLLLVGLATTAEYRGWSFTRVNQLKNVPKTVRDNPGVYRSHYLSSPRAFGGK